MTEFAPLINQLAASLIIGGVTLIIAIALLKKGQQDHDKKFEVIDRDCRECRDKQERKHADTEHGIQTLRTDVLKGIGDLSIQFARFDAKNDLARDIANNLAKILHKDI